MGRPVFFLVLFVSKVCPLNRGHFPPHVRGMVLGPVTLYSKGGDDSKYSLRQASTLQSLGPRSHIY